MKLTKLYLENIRTFIKRNYRKDVAIDKKNSIVTNLDKSIYKILSKCYNMTVTYSKNNR